MLAGWVVPTPPEAKGGKRVQLHGPVSRGEVPAPPAGRSALQSSWATSQLMVAPCPWGGTSATRHRQFPESSRELPRVSVTCLHWQRWSWPPPDGFGGSPGVTPSREGHASADGPPGTLASAVPPLRFTLACVAPSSWPWQTPVDTGWAGPQGRTRPPAASTGTHPAHQDTHSPKPLSCRLRRLTEQPCPPPDLKPAPFAGTALGAGARGGGGWPPRSSLVLCPTVIQRSSTERS